MILSDTVLLAVGYAVNFAALENIDLAGGPGNNRSWMHRRLPLPVACP